jgi:hypothetical protein
MTATGDGLVASVSSAVKTRPAKGLARRTVWKRLAVVKVPVTRSGASPPVRLTLWLRTRARPEKERALSRSSRKSGQDKPSSELELERPQTKARRSGSGYGRGASNTASTTVKIAVLAPRPRARVSTVTNVKPGRWRKERRARRTSRARVSAKRSLAKGEEPFRAARLSWNAAIRSAGAFRRTSRRVRSQSRANPAPPFRTRAARHWSRNASAMESPASSRKDFGNAWSATA